MTVEQLAFNELETLFTSWNRVATLCNEDPDVVTQPLIKSIYLCTDLDGSLTFKKKPVRGALQRFGKAIRGERKEESFKEAIVRIKELYARCSGITESPKRDVLHTLEERINQLGRYVFAKRFQRTCLLYSPPTLLSYQLRISVPGSLLEPTQVHRGLPNLNLKLCWLNSLIKYLAVSTASDQILLQKARVDEFEPMRVAIVRLVDALRRNFDQHIIDALQQELVQEIINSNFTNLVTEQSDPTEYLGTLLDKLSRSTLDKGAIKVALIYESTKEGTLKEGQEMEWPRLILDYAKETIVDVNERIISSCSDAISGDYYIKENGTHRKSAEKDDKTLFLKRYACTKFPTYVEITLSRGQPETGKNNFAVLEDQRIQMQPGGTIKLKEYDPLWEMIDGAPRIVGTEEKAECTFKVIAAIEHVGETTSEGHYVTYARDKNGVVVTHNDMHVISNKCEEVWSRSYHFLLKLISRKAI